MFHDTGADWSISKSDSIELILVLVDLFFILEKSATLGASPPRGGRGTAAEAAIFEALVKRPIKRN